MTWRAVYTEPRQEIRARDELRSAGLTVFLPYERVTRRKKLRMRNAHRVETVEQPLFDRYLFVDSDAFHLIRSCRGVVDLVRAAGEVLSVPGEIMTDMIALADGDGLLRITDETLPSFGFRGVVGDQFEFSAQAGASLAGFVGQIRSLSVLDSQGKVGIWLDMLGKRHKKVVGIEAIGRILQAVA